MLPVKSRSQIEKNVLSLRNYIHSPDPHDREFASGLIQRGACFVGLADAGRLVFGPSRFVGYIENSRLKHTRNKVKDGKETNRAISRALGSSPRQNAELEQRYQEFCKSSGIPLNASGPGGRPRKFWPVSSDLGAILNREPTPMKKPKKRLFEDSGQHHGTVVLNWVGTPEREFTWYGQAFHEAGKQLVDHLKQDPTFGLDGFPPNSFKAVPIVYLYRHAMELYLKGIILAGAAVLQLRGEPSLNIKDALDTHSLQGLLADVERIFAGFGWGWDFKLPAFRSLSGFRSIIGQLANVDGAPTPSVIQQRKTVRPHLWRAAFGSTFSPSARFWTQFTKSSTVRPLVRARSCSCNTTSGRRLAGGSSRTATLNSPNTKPPNISQLVSSSENQHAREEEEEAV